MTTNAMTNFYVFFAITIFVWLTTFKKSSSIQIHTDHTLDLFKEKEMTELPAGYVYDWLLM